MSDKFWEVLISAFLRHSDHQIIRTSESQSFSDNQIFVTDIRFFQKSRFFQTIRKFVKMLMCPACHLMILVHGLIQSAHISLLYNVQCVPFLDNIYPFSNSFHIQSYLPTCIWWLWYMSCPTLCIMVCNDSPVVLSLTPLPSHSLTAPMYMSLSVQLIDSTLSHISTSHLHQILYSQLVSIFIVPLFSLCLIWYIQQPFSYRSIVHAESLLPLHSSVIVHIWSNHCWWDYCIYCLM